VTGYLLAGLWLLFVALIIGTFAGASRLERARNAPRPHQPGNLARDDWPANQRTEGLGDLSSVPETEGDAS
jgi:hypothetical protein